MDVHDDERRAEAIRASTAFAIWGGVAGVAVGLTINWWPLSGWHPARIVAFGVGAIAAGLLVRLVRDRMSLKALSATLGLFSLYIGAAQIVATGPRSFAMVYLHWVVLLAFAYFPRRWALLHAALAVTVLAAVFAIQPGWPVPFAYWLFLALTIGTTAWVVSSLVERADSARRALADLNSNLEQRVTDQVEELGRLGRLRRFLPAPVLQALVSSPEETVLEPHRCQIAVLFCDLRGFTRFAASAEPEEVSDLLAAYHDVVGGLVRKHEATVGALAGDGVMLYFNDPVPCDRPCHRAVQLAVDIAEPLEQLASDWSRRGLQLGHGIGIAYGYATLGMTGFEGRRDYTAIGPVVNLAARLCDAAAPGEVLLDPRAAAALEGAFPLESARPIALKGFDQPVVTQGVDLASLSSRSS